MESKEKKAFLELLQKEKNRIYKNLGYFREVLGTGEKGIPTHIADHGTDEFEKDLEIGVSDSEEQILIMIDEAIKKLQKDEYGICETCGKKIRKQRLKALPYVMNCIECQKTKEKSEG